MKVRVRVFGDISATVGSKHSLELPDTATVLTLTNTIQTNAGKTRRGYLGPFKVGGADLAIMINGKNIALLQGTETRLQDHDDIVIMPFVVGG